MTDLDRSRVGLQSWINIRNHCRNGVFQGLLPASVGVERILEIKDDATYRLTSTRRGTASNDSGVVIRNGGAVLLRSSTRLVRNGERLYGVMTSSGRGMNIMLQKAQ